MSQGRRTYRGLADLIAVDVALGLRPVGALFTERIRREMERKGVRFTVVARGAAARE